LCENVSGCSFGVRQHVGVPQADDVPALGAKVFGAAFVPAGGFEVLAAVEFDCELRAAAGKIDDEGGFDMLAREGRTVARDQVPDGEFGGGRVVAQFAGSAGQFAVDSALHKESVLALFWRSTF
jgi:hypothetical protein